MAAHPPRAATAPSRVPRQRRRTDGEVIVVLARGQDAVTALTNGAALATRDNVRLGLVVSEESACDDRARRMAVLDEALHLVRGHMPDLEVRVYEDVSDIPSFLKARAHRLHCVVISTNASEELVSAVRAAGLPALTERR